jgi:hypothetical protein
VLNFQPKSQKRSPAVGKPKTSKVKKPKDEPDTKVCHFSDLLCCLVAKLFS